jgi:hypothetical protein
MILNGDIANGNSNSIPQDKARAGQLLIEAIERDPNRSLAHAAMGRLRRLENRLVESQIELEKAVALDQNDAREGDTAQSTRADFVRRLYGPG